MGVSYHDFAAALSAHDGEGVSKLLASDVVFNDLPLGEVHHGPEAVAQAVDATSNFSRDLRVEVLNEFVCDGRFAAKWVMTGTTASGSSAPFRIQGSTIGKLDRDGLVVEASDYWDMAALRAQLEA